MNVALERVGKSLEVAPGGNLVLKTGDTLRIAVSFEYMGQEQTFTLRGEIGTRHGILFDKIIDGEKLINLPDSDTFTPFERSVDIKITSEIKGGVYDLRCRIKGATEWDEFPDVIEIQEVSELPKLILWGAGAFGGVVLLTKLLKK